MYVNNNKKYNAKVTTTTTTTTTVLIMLAAIVVAGATTGIIAPLAPRSVSAQTFTSSDTNLIAEPKAPMAASEEGNNVYIVWWTNKSENWEVMFRASNDGGATFGDKINLSNSTDTDSQNAEMIAAGNNVYVSWWETNPDNGSSESVLRVSTDNGQTFGPLLMLGTNGTISTTNNTASAVPS
jgi:hypothetical protein